MLTFSHCSGGDIRCLSFSLRPVTEDGSFCGKVGPYFPLHADPHVHLMSLPGPPCPNLFYPNLCVYPHFYPCPYKPTQTPPPPISITCYDNVWANYMMWHQIWEDERRCKTSTFTGIVEPPWWVGALGSWRLLWRLNNILTQVLESLCLHFTLTLEVIWYQKKMTSCLLLPLKINAHPVVHRDALQLAISKTAQDIMSWLSRIINLGVPKLLLFKEDRSWRLVKFIPCGLQTTTILNSCQILWRYLFF